MGELTPRLLIYKPAGTVTLMLTGKNVWKIGRGPENDIILNDYAVSRHHAELHLTDEESFILTDIGSGNGSFLKGQKILTSHVLEHGDLLTMGRVHLEFQAAQQPLTFQPLRKTVLMLHTSSLQGKVWQELLASQDIAVAQLDTGIDLSSLVTLREQHHALPNLLLLDMTGLQANPYHFCRWCRDTYPQIKVILLSSQRTDISASERKWAIHQGAVDLFAGFSEAQLFQNLAGMMSKMQVILNTIDQPELQQRPFLEASLSLQRLHKKAFSPSVDG